MSIQRAAAARMIATRATLRSSSSMVNGPGRKLVQTRHRAPAPVIL
jgi:hypothetical protein